MRTVLPVSVCVVFLMLAVWHFIMAFSSLRGESIAVPTVNGRPLFTPSRIATAAVGLGLVLIAALVAGSAQLVPLGLPHTVLVWLSYALALGLLARAIGEFKYVGFFKRVRGSMFAKLDTLVYSPLCFLLSAGVALNAWQNGA